VEFSAAIPVEQVSLLNKVQGTSLNEIGIAREYPDIFPEELPGMSPDRDIEFIIELLPGSPPISKRPYRMPINELVELKKQILNYNQRDSFALVHPLGENPCFSWKRKMEHNGCVWITDH
jgi:hypothetical protein